MRLSIFYWRFCYVFVIIWLIMDLWVWKSFWVYYLLWSWRIFGNCWCVDNVLSFVWVFDGMLKLKCWRFFILWFWILFCWENCLMGWLYWVVWWSIWWMFKWWGEWVSWGVLKVFVFILNFLNSCWCGVWDNWFLKRFLNGFSRCMVSFLWWLVIRCLCVLVVWRVILLWNWFLLMCLGVSYLRFRMELYW